MPLCNKPARFRRRSSNSIQTTSVMKSRPSTHKTICTRRVRKPIPIQKQTFFQYRTDVCEYIRTTYAQQRERVKERHRILGVSMKMNSALGLVALAYHHARNHAAELREQIPFLQTRMLSDGKSAALDKFQEMLEKFLKTVEHE